MIAHVTVAKELDPGAIHQKIEGTISAWCEVGKKYGRILHTGPAPDSKLTVYTCKLSGYG
jgi:hypothetical protein